MLYNRGLVIFIAVLLGGCAAAPKSASEFRQAVSDGAMGHAHESFVVQRSANDIGKTFEAQAEKCINVQLNRRFTLSSQRYGNTESNTQFLYTPAVKRGKNHSEMTVQVHVTGNVAKLQKEPKGGYFVLLADANALEKKRSKVDVYYSVYRAKSLAAAVKGWAEGNDLTCPDVAATFK